MPSWFDEKMQGGKSKSKKDNSSTRKKTWAEGYIYGDVGPNTGPVNPALNPKAAGPINPTPDANPAAEAASKAPERTTTTKSVDPLASQLAFFQLIAPFIQQQIQAAVGGMNSTADSYQQQMGGVTSNLPESVQGLYSEVVPNVAGSIRDQGGAMAQSAAAKPEYDFMMGLIQSLREQQERDIQNQMLIQQLQAELAKKPAGGEDDELASMFAALLQPDATAKK